ncbi:MAG: HIT family protein [bacterium]|nr:HIT family protein [bacterium]
MNSDCIFCKIAAGEIPSSTVYEDQDFRVIMDINPASKGHAIILPKEHAANVFELSDETASKIFVVAKKVATAMKEELNCEGINILQNNGELAGQTVFHVHMHLIPRYKDDTVTIGWAHKEAYNDDFAAIAKSIAARIK